MRTVTMIVVSSILVLMTSMTVFSQDLFDSAVSYHIGYWPFSVISADFDGDGDIDLASTSWKGNTSIFFNLGDGTFDEAEVFWSSAFYSYGTVAADLDGDGDMDLVEGSSLNDGGDYFVHIFLNAGDGTFGRIQRCPLGRYPQNMFATDLDSDGNLDLVVSNQGSGSVSILFNNGDGTFGTAVDYSGLGGQPNEVISFDFDGDSHNDVAVVNKYELIVLINQGDGTLGAAVTYEVVDFPRFLSASDFDNDNDIDLVVSGAYGNSVLLNYGDGTFATAVNYSGSGSVVTDDLDGDDDVDIAFVTGMVLINDGYGSFDETIEFASSAIPWNPTCEITVSDFNGDGYNDLAFVQGTANDSVTVLINNGLAGDTDVTGTTISPDTIFSFFANALDPIPAVVRIGQTAEEGRPVNVDTSSLLVNNLSPELITSLESYPGFFGEVWELQVNIVDLIGTYEPWWDTSTPMYDVTGSYSDATTFNITGDFVAIGHRSGDFNRDGQVDITDLLMLVEYMFGGVAAPEMLELADVNGNCVADISDLVYMVDYMFTGGATPVHCSR